jgi:hypothetical protein
VSGAGQVRLLTADGRPDGALDPGAASPDRLTLPKGSYPSFTPNIGSFWDADLTVAGKLVLGGTEAYEVSLSRSNDTSVIAMSGVLGPSSPVSASGALVPVVPERLLDTRPGSQVGYQGPKPGHGSVVRLQITGAGSTKVPPSATAVVLTVTGTLTSPNPIDPVHSERAMRSRYPHS